MPRKKPKFEAVSATDFECAAIILAGRKRYDGLPLMWARLWATRYAPALLRDAADRLAKYTVEDGQRSD